MTGSYQYLSGISIQTFENGSPLADDSFIISHPQTYVHKNGNYFSQKIRYGDIQETTLHTLSTLFSFGSMAFRNVEEFSAVDHVHGLYNYVDIDFPYEGTTGSTTVAVLKIDGKVHSLDIPPVRVYGDYKPVPGQFKFVAIPNPKAINVYADDFDGWVYADGSSYRSSDFQYSSCFESAGPDLFKVPLVNDMIYMQSESGTTVDTTVHPQVNELPSHNHTIPVTLSGYASGAVRFNSGGYDGSQNCTHSSDQKKNGTFKCNITSRFDNVRMHADGAIQEEGTIGGLTRPTLSRLPIMVYIGKRVIV